jgi:hypothetical protein
MRPLHDGAPVLLSREDLALAESVAVSRVREAIASGRPERYGRAWWEDPERLARGPDLGFSSPSLSDLVRGGSYEAGRVRTHLVGALGELVAARALGVPWAPSLVPDRLAGDLPGDVHVRTTTRPYGDLIVYRGDADSGRFLLVARVRGLEVFSVPGWLPARVCKALRWWRSDAREPAFFVPQSQLCPVSMLVDVIASGSILGSAAEDTERGLTR